MTLELEEDRSSLHPDRSCGRADAPSASNVPPQSVSRDESADSTLDEVTSDPSPSAVVTESAKSTPKEVADPTSSTVAAKTANSTLNEITSDSRSSTIYTESAGSEPPPTQNMADQAESSLAHSPSRVSSMLVTLYSSFLASIRQIGVLLSPRTVLPRPEEQDDETKITQELSQAQRQLVVEEECIWKQLLEVTSKEGTEEDVSFLARELEDKSTKILTSYERRKNPPADEVYGQSRIILQAMGVPCIVTKGGVEGEALAAAIVRDGLAHYVASEDTVSFFSSLLVLLVDRWHRMYWFTVHLCSAMSPAVLNPSRSSKDTRSETHWTWTPPSSSISRCCWEQTSPTGSGMSDRFVPSSSSSLMDLSRKLLKESPSTPLNPQLPTISNRLGLLGQSFSSNLRYRPQSCWRRGNPTTALS